MATNTDNLNYDYPTGAGLTMRATLHFVDARVTIKNTSDARDIIIEEWTLPRLQAYVNTLQKIVDESKLAFQNYVPKIPPQTAP